MPMITVIYCLVNVAYFAVLTVPEIEESAAVAVVGLHSMMQCSYDVGNFFAKSSKKETPSVITKDAP